jgi:hypothetical protein
MASNINANNIDGTFPVAGVDNDSQGFRTNFSNIKNNFTYAKNEISDLQSNALLKSALTGTTLNNDLANALLSSAQIKNFSETRYDLGTISGSVTVSHQNGHYQQATMNGNATLVFSNFPASGYLGRVRLELTVDLANRTLTLPSAVTLGMQGIAGWNGSYSPPVITFAASGTYILEFTSDDALSTIHIQDLSRPRDYFHSDHIRLVPKVITDARGASGDVAGLIAVDTTTPAIWVCLASYDGTTLIWRKAELETISNEATITSNVTTTNSSLSNITGLQFTAEPNVRYSFECVIPFQHSAGTTNTHTFSVKFNSGTCVYQVTQQTSNTSVDSVYVGTASDNAGGIATTAQAATTRLARIRGTFVSTSGRETVYMRFATSGGTLTALAGSYLRFNRV